MEDLGSGNSIHVVVEANKSPLLAALICHILADRKLKNRYSELVGIETTSADAPHNSGPMSKRDSC